MSECVHPGLIGEIAASDLGPPDPLLRFKLYCPHCKTKWGGIFTDAGLLESPVRFTFGSVLDDLADWGKPLQVVKEAAPYPEIGKII